VLSVTVLTELCVARRGVHVCIASDGGVAYGKRKKKNIPFIHNSVNESYTKRNAYADRLYCTGHSRIARRCNRTAGVGRAAWRGRESFRTAGSGTHVPIRNTDWLCKSCNEGASLYYTAQHTLPHTNVIRHSQSHRLSMSFMRWET
jgi:hypothetical protein